MILLVALRKEILEQARSYRLLIVSLVFLLFGLTSPLLAKLAPEFIKMLPQGEEMARLIPAPTVADAVGQYVKNISQFAVLLAVLMGMGAVAQEKDKGTAALMLSKPLPRWAFLLAKFAALGLTFMAGTAVAAIGGYYYTTVLFQAPDVGGWLALNGFLLVFTLVYLAVTLLCSTVSRSMVVAGGLAFGALLLLVMLNSLPVVGDYMPSALLGWGSLLLTGAGRAAGGALWVSLGLIAASLLASWAVFERQEL
jgi:ABC-2 type transport system permease protein